MFDIILVEFFKVLFWFLCLIYINDINVVFCKLLFIFFVDDINIFNKNLNF